MRELKPCPCCGEKYIQSFPPIKGYGWYVECIECYLSIFRCTDPPIHSQEAAEEAWNTRSDGWISVEDRLPVDNKIVLVYCEYADMTMGFDEVENGEWIGAKTWAELLPSSEVCTPTHWQPLPEAPK